MAAVSPLLALGLAVLMLVTSVHAGQMRGQPRAAGSAVLCVGGEAVRVAVDADGQPVVPPHLCPDCVVSLAAVPPLPALDVPLRATRHAQVWPTRDIAPRTPRAAGPLARGPPVAG
ncbi:hypothetical protein DKT77_15470 [Meridianimarinicoccus roseus]|jgi:hypothetical protein|uniref:DUF2946 domain-containing protein n=1 Tax=Meridianimarinicoccus roseus TaxID=2072018 RepID=A0A2V2L834_9RHOB|nr:hypothetical protein [Meridianimarinicoccus roseus]PWR01540.1 hypothetical protein DKT77_15470 [Meridianimarinicoccus roseus]